MYSFLHSFTSCEIIWRNLARISSNNTVIQWCISYMSKNLSERRGQIRRFKISSRDISALNIIGKNGSDQAATALTLLIILPVKVGHTCFTFFTASSVDPVDHRVIVARKTHKNVGANINCKTTMQKSTNC